MNPGGTLLVDISGYFLDAPYVPTPHGIWTWAVPGVTDAFQNIQIEGARAFGGWPGLSVALLGDGRVVGWSVPTFGGYHLSPNRTVLSAGANVVQVAGSSITYSLHSDGTVAVWGPTHKASSGTGPTQTRRCLSGGRQTKSARRAAGRPYRAS
ncbi:MAG TPA: hypothetical protein VKB37_15630 [Jatrophihabitantaceae bacterium]|nr:hypothetical protein [Jatrophihabitantaceae bacterium]